MEYSHMEDKNKITAIIPTLNLCYPVMKSLINVLLSDNLIYEIIIIDNSNSLEINHPKIKVLKQESNQFVNPSWNLGIKQVTTKYYVILNDDIMIAHNLLLNVYNEYIELEKVMPVGIVGISDSCLRRSTIEECVEQFAVLNSEIKLDVLDTRCYGYGFILFGNTDSYYYIPDTLKIWCGDDWLFFMNQNNNKRNLVIRDTIIRTPVSYTSDRPEFDLIKKQDLENYKLIDKNFWYV